MADDSAMSAGALIFATLADVYLSSGMVDEAISILKDGLVRNPSYSLAKIILGRAYYIKGDIKEAIKILEGVYADAPDSENLNLYLGYCYRRLNETEKAINYFETTLKINPTNNEAKRELEILRPVPKPVEVLQTIVEQHIRLPEDKPLEFEPKTVVQQKPVVLPATEIETKPSGATRLIAPPTPLESLNEPMNALLSIKSVKGAFISSKDGLLIQSYYAERPDIEEICALVAEIYNDAITSLKALREDSIERCIIEKDDETICVISAGDTLFTVITKKEGTPGIVFAFARKIIEEIREILA